MKRELYSEPTQPASPRAPIRPELVAAKLAAIHNLEYPEILEQLIDEPRLYEMIMHLQAMSLRLGGLVKCTGRLVQESPEQLGTPMMRKAKGRSYSAEEKLAIWSEFPPCNRPRISGEAASNGIFEEILASTQRSEISTLPAADRKKLLTAVNRIPDDDFRTLCRKAAEEKLPELLVALCTEKSQGFAISKTAGVIRRSRGCNEDDDYYLHYQNQEQRWRGIDLWFFGDVIGAILSMMDRHAAQVQKRLAMTKVAREIFDTLEYANKAAGPVRIVGNSRFGKTEAMETYCEMYPGRARLVRVPESNSMSDFFRSIAEPLGIDCSYGSNHSRLKERIEYVIGHVRIFFVLDEGAFLVPQNYSATTAPRRLNWTRTEIMDRGLAIAIAVTPQTFDGAVSRFVKKTRYAMEQFLGRNLLTCELPSLISEEDMIAVARIHFPEVEEDALGFIAAEARISQNYLQAVAAIAKYARHLTDYGKRRITLHVLETAIAKVLPRRAAPEPDSSLDTARQPGARRTPGRSTEQTVKASLKAPARAVQPSRMQPVRTGSLVPFPLRGAGLERVEADLVPVEA